MNEHVEAKKKNMQPGLNAPVFNLLPVVENKNGARSSLSALSKQVFSIPMELSQQGYSNQAV